jgi:hypothetical protein
VQFLHGGGNARRPRVSCRLCFMQAFQAAIGRMTVFRRPSDG